MRATGITFLAIGILILNACQSHKTIQNTTSTTKGSDTTKAATNALTGKWKLTQTLMDIGDGKGTWQAVGGKASYAIFGEDAKLSSTVFPEYVNYKIKDSTMLMLATKDKVVQNYRYQLKGDTLITSPAGPIFCREACGSKLVKVKD